MLANANILRIDRVSAGDATGEVSHVEGDSIDSLRCFLDDVTSSQRRELGVDIQDASRVCFVGKFELQESGEVPPKAGDRMTVQEDGEESAVAEVVMIKSRTLGSISHYEIYLKRN